MLYSPSKVCSLSLICLLALELILFNSESHLKKLLLLLGVNLLETGGDRGAGVSASVHDVLASVVLSVVEQSLNAGLGEAPSTGVKRLLLAPDNCLGVGVHVEVLLKLLPREGVQLLNASEGNIVDLVLGSVLVKSGPDLTSAENDTLNLVRRLDSTSLMLRIGDDPLEASILASELLDVAARERMTEERLREEDDESYKKKPVSIKSELRSGESLTLAVLAVHLSAESVEQVGRRSEVGDLHVTVLMLADELLTSRELSGILVAKLEVSLKTS